MGKKIELGEGSTTVRQITWKENKFFFKEEKNIF